MTFEQPRSTFRTWIGVVLLFGLFALFAWAVIGAMPRGTDYEATRGKARAEKLKALHEETAPQLSSYAWLDKAKGSVRMPIDRAMELTVADLAQKKPAPANPLPPEGDKAGLQVTAPVGPTPAPSASPEGAAPRPTPAIAVTGKDSEAEGQAAAAANPPDAAPGTQPGPSATPAAAPPAGSNRPQPGQGKPTATPVQSAPGTPIPVPGKSP
ncbi:MAG TPA: hypothetical protein VF551_05950 [Chthoniobacterales bacterium]